jgi:thiol:disulfide interchange protein DsbC
MRKFIVIFFVVCFLTCLIMIHNTYSIETCDHNCTKCHRITNDEILSLVRELVPDAKVLDVRTSFVKGIWEVAIEAKGQKGIIYVDFSKKYIVTGAILDVKAKTNVTQERLIEVNKVDVSKIPLDDALVMGDKDAKIRVIVFDDPD